MAEDPGDPTLSSAAGEPPASDGPPPAVQFAGLSDWQSLEVSKDDGEEAEHAAESAQATLAERLLSILSAERLVVLAGLGTSMEIQGSVDMSDLWDEAGGLKGFEKAAALSPEATESKDIEILLSRCQSALDLEKDSELESFVSAAESHILERCGFVSEETDLPTHRRFLRRIARRSTRLPRSEIFTTNYDLAFERAAAATRFFLIDGFQLRPPYRFDGNALDLDLVRRHTGEGLTLEPNVAQFLKLHGSVDWDLDDSTVRRVSGKPKKPALIYPRQNKFQLSYAPPYLEFMARFQMALRARDVAVVVVGFGFNDEHLVQPIRLAVESNVGLRLVVVSPDLGEDKESIVNSWIELASGGGDRRLTFIKTTFERFTDLLPDIAPPDERELHDKRIEDASSALGV
ncbi:MAG TPA: SIR2 family protein [Solirubrobacterales bacterium]